jgi:hypothetical protein
MNMKQLTGIGVLVASAMLSGNAVAGNDGHEAPATGLVRVVQENTADFRDVNIAMAAGYASLGSCVSGPEKGAMGVHYAKGPLIGDGALDAEQPELLIYEVRGNRIRLVGVEFLVLADQWNATHTAPPVLMGQHFHYVGSPNRYGLPPFYELHVWAWRDNRNGTFVDWNPAVSCDEFVP